MDISVYDLIKVEQLLLGMGKSLIFWRYFSPIILSVLALIFIATIYLPKYMEQVATEHALEESKQLAIQIKALRNYYTYHVVDKVLGYSELKASSEHIGYVDRIPLPATLIHELNEKYSRQNFSLKLYSKYPFPNRQQRQLGEFEQQAWRVISQQPEATFSQITLNKDGERYLRVAIADTMSSQACVNCHNSHPDSPKVDWQLGDLRGVLEITRNLEPIISHGNSISFNIVIMFIALLVIVALVFFLVAQKLYASLQKQEHLNRQLSETVSQLADANEHIQSNAEQLIKSERMNLLDNLVVGVSHELGTPLGISITAASALRENVEKLEKRYVSKTLASRQLAQFIEQAKNGSSLLETNLDRVSILLNSFKHIVIDPADDDLKHIDFHRFLNDIVFTLSASFPHKDYKVSLATQGNWHIETCPVHWTQVITILTSNAIEHAFAQRENGTITLSAQCNEHSMIFTFSDDGKGMEENEKEKIFQPFYTSKRGSGGTGLGLHVLRNIVELKLNGHVVCHTTLQQGASFVITVPLLRTNN